MQIKDIAMLLESNSYPGRGIILGRSLDNEKAIISYFIMGRSENSRNRVFSRTDDGIRTEAHEPDKMTDPSLLIYHPVRRVEIDGDILHIVSNGDQTDTIKDYLLMGKTYNEALLTRTFEPDAPNYTPRISGLLFPSGSYMLSILKTLGAPADSCQRSFFNYAGPEPGTAHFIHTYSGDGDPLPSFVGEPAWVKLPTGNPDDMANAIWDALDADNKVSLFVSEIDIASGKETSAIIKNKNSGD